MQMQGLRLRFLPLRGEKIVEQREIDRRLSYRELFSSDVGEKVIADMSERFYFSKTTWSENPLEMAYCEGQRAVILWLHHMCSDKWEKLN